ncbi:MAG TPA: hypothetical protein VMT34_18375 [Aggregatilineales bacterium]|nr:hypothetical protein [Aggregatilineales bacterium]
MASDIIQAVYGDIQAVASTLGSVHDVLSDIETAADVIAGILTLSAAIGDEAGPAIAATYEESVRPVLDEIITILAEVRDFLNTVVGVLQEVDQVASGHFSQLAA